MPTTFRNMAYLVVSACLASTLFEWISLLLSPHSNIVTFYRYEINSVENVIKELSLLLKLWIKIGVPIVVEHTVLLT